jgi:hypothetical protein
MGTYDVGGGGRSIGISKRYVVLSYFARRRSKEEGKSSTKKDLIATSVDHPQRLVLTEGKG